MSNKLQTLKQLITPILCGFLLEIVLLFVSWMPVFGYDALFNLFIWIGGIVAGFAIVFRTKTIRMAVLKLLVTHVGVFLFIVIVEISGIYPPIRESLISMASSMHDHASSSGIILFLIGVWIFQGAALLFVIIRRIITAVRENR